MKRSLFLLFLAGLCIGWLVAPAAAQDVPAEDAEATAADSEDFEPTLKYDDYTVKAYTLSFFGGGFSGATYLENQELWPRTVLTEGANDIVAYSGDVLQVSRDVNHYDAAHKKIEPGSVFGARVGVYIADNFHLDLVGSYATGKAVTSMLYTPDPDRYPDDKYRVVVDEDDGFEVYSGGVNLVYDAQSAQMFGLTPRIGFGLGGVINRYSELEDITGLYLQGLFGLEYELFDNFNLTGQVDVSTFAFQVEELGYSNMVAYKTYSLGISWFIDVIPPQVRAARYNDEG